MKKIPQKSKKETPKKRIANSAPASEDIREFMNEIIADSDVRMKRYMGAISEDFQHRVSAIAEQFLGLNDKIDIINEKLDIHSSILDKHSSILDEHTTQFSCINDTLDSHTEMIGRLMIDVEEIKVGMNEKVSRNEFNKLESRLVSLESFVFSKEGKISKK